VIQSPSCTVDAADARRRVVDLQLARAGDARLPHPARDDGGVRWSSRRAR
jgi:hypothetical protein